MLFKHLNDIFLGLMSINFLTFYVFFSSSMDSFLTMYDYLPLRIDVDCAI